MTFTREQQKKAYKNLPQEVQSFIMDNETTDLIGDYLKETGLSEEQAILADSEILYAMFGLQTLPDAINNIAKLSNKNINDLSKLKTDLENNIFNKIQNTKNARLLGSDKSKILEIGKKYSLDQNQTDELVKIVDQPFVYTRKPEELIGVTTSKLGISELLAEQLIGDLKTRIFEHTTKTTRTVQERPAQNVPEQRPEITPMVEPEEKVRVRPVPVGFAGTTTQPIPKPQIPTPELVQRPVSVPRYTAVPVEEERVNSQEPVASIKRNTEPKKTPEPVPEPVKRYTVDPYREPLE